MWSKTSRVVYIDTRLLFFKVLVVVLAVFAVITYWNWTRVTKIRFISNELEANWTITHPETIKQIGLGLKESTTVTGVNAPSDGISMSLHSKREVREYLWDGTDYLLDKKTGNVIEIDGRLKKYLVLAKREIKIRSPFGEMLEWKEVQEIFKIGTRAVIRDLDSGNSFMACRTGGYSRADIEPLTREDTLKLKAIYNGTINWKRRAVVVQTGERKIAASLTGAPHGQGGITNNDLRGKAGLYFSNEEKNSGINISHQMMIWKAAGKTEKHLGKMNPEEAIIAMFTAIDQQDLKSLEFMVKQPEELKTNELSQIIGVTVTGMKKKSLLSYNVTVSVSLKKGPYNQKRHVTVNLNKDFKNGCYVADNKFLETILFPMSNNVK